MISNCEDSCVFVFDHTATVTIDDCKRCRFFIGPTKGRYVGGATLCLCPTRHCSVFIRDSTDCDILVACQQYRCAMQCAPTATLSRYSSQHT